MARAGGDALAWAMDLWRHPATRHALRARPLPDGMEQLLSIATGAGSALAQAAADSGESPGRLVELVRFALREQLFFPGADAYRTLGLSRAASPQAIRSHHRVLQQWLHPDRCGDEDAVFAARVNAAWDQVRTPERRQAYDAGLAESPLPTAPSSQAAHSVVWRHEALPERDLRAVRWRQRAPLFALLAACIGLGTLAVLEQTRQPAMYTDARDVSPRQDPLAALVLPPPPRKPAATPSPARRTPAERPPRQSAPLIAVAPPGPETRPLPAAPRATAALPAPVLPPPPPTEPRVTPAASPPPAATAAAVTALQPAPSQPQSPPQPAVATQPEQAAARDPSPAAASPAPLDPRRVRAAERVWNRLLVYLGGRGARVPPIWDSLGVQQAAESMRSGLAAEPPSSLAAPAWRISGEAATVDAGLVYKDGNPGRLRARLVWREERWLVANVAMERDR